MRKNSRILAIALLSAVLFTNNMSVHADKLKDRYQSNANAISNQYASPFYSQVYQQYPDELKNAAASETVGVDIYHPADVTGSTPSTYEDNADPAVKGLYFDDKTASVKWNFRIEKEGLYEIHVTYYQKTGSYLPISRKIRLDDQVPFDELNTVSFPRFYVDAGKPAVNNLGDEVRPSQTEIARLTDYALTDSQGKYAEPFVFHLKTGSHSLTFSYIDQPMTITKIELKSPQRLLSYREVEKQYPAADVSSASGSVYFEAEDREYIDLKTDSSISIGSDSDPKTSPQSITHVRMNMIGSYTWRKGNQAIAWKFKTEKAGLYKISMRVKQAYNNGLLSCRQIAIDDQVPFAEFQEYYFRFSREFYTETLSDQSGKPYLVYLTEGDHTLSMTAKMGDYTDVYHTMNESVVKMGDLIRRITMITGSVPDVNYDYRLSETIPDLIPRMQELRDNVGRCIQQTSALSDGTPAIVNSFQLIDSQLKEMIKNPGLVSKRLADLQNALISLGDWMTVLTEQPLAIDFIEITPPEARPTVRKSSFVDKFVGIVQSFMLSFFKDYDTVGNMGQNNQITSNLDVWISRGKEWSEILKEVSDSDFTQKTGINLKVNILPSSSLTSSANPLLLAINSGRAPDVALSIPSNLPVEYAIRNAVVDLSAFDDYAEVRSRFVDAINIPYEYEGGTYALPETMNMRLMFYRKDIFTQLGLSVPQTWDDVYNNLFPALYQNKMEMYIPAFYDMFLVQHNGRYYTDDGYLSALDTKEAYAAFKQMVELYTNYGVPFSANFFNRMRSGEMPIGIDGYAFYMQIAFAAPELQGKWDIAPIPGVKNADGTINRNTGGLIAESDIILSQSKQQADAWKFLKWWTSKETQINFGSQVEARIGSNARWNSANKEAFQALPWPREHLAVIEDNWNNVVEQRVVLGGYFTGRHITNALNRCVVSNESPRDSLEEAVEQINIELKRRQESKGIFRQGKK